MPKINGNPKTPETFCLAKPLKCYDSMSFLQRHTNLTTLTVNGISGPRFALDHTRARLMLGFV